MNGWMDENIMTQPYVRVHVCKLLFSFGHYGTMLRAKVEKTSCLLQLQLYYFHIVRHMITSLNEPACAHLKKMMIDE